MHASRPPWWFAPFACQARDRVFRACYVALKCRLRPSWDACARLGERAEAAVLPRRDERGERLRRRATLRVEASSVLVIRGARCAVDFQGLVRTCGQNGSVETVLVVDDEPTIREVVVQYLQREGYATLEAGDGDAARELLEGGWPIPAGPELRLAGVGGRALCAGSRAVTRRRGLQIT